MKERITWLVDVLHGKRRTTYRVELAEIDIGLYVGTRVWVSYRYL